jgi:hypothetical protein
MVDDAVNIDVVQKQLRHSDPRMMLGIYSHIVGDAQRRAVNKSAAAVRDHLAAPVVAYFLPPFTRKHLPSTVLHVSLLAKD